MVRGNTVTATLVVLDEAPLIVAGLAAVLEPYRHRIAFAGTASHTAQDCRADLLLYDDLASPTPAAGVRVPGTRRIIFSWIDDPDLIRAALAAGADSYLSKALTAKDLVDALERIHHGEQLVLGAQGDLDVGTIRSRWTGDEAGLSARESQILHLICQGYSNTEIASSVFVSVNTVKTYIRSTYRKIDVYTRPQAVIWGMQHGFAAPPDTLPSQPPT